MYGRECRELVQCLGDAHIAGVQNCVGTVEVGGDGRRASLPTARRMSVGQHDDAHRSSLLGRGTAGAEQCGDASYFRWGVLREPTAQQWFEDAERTTERQRLTVEEPGAAVNRGAVDDTVEGHHVVHPLRSYGVHVKSSTGAVDALRDVRAGQAGHLALKTDGGTGGVWPNPFDLADLVVGLSVTLEIEHETECFLRRHRDDGLADTFDHDQRTLIDRKACGGTPMRTTSPSWVTGWSTEVSSSRTAVASAIGTPKTRSPVVSSSVGFSTRTIAPSPSSAGLNVESNNVEGSSLNIDCASGTSGLASESTARRPSSADRAVAGVAGPSAK